MIKQKIHHHKKYKKTKLLYHKQRFCTLRRAVKLEINKALTNFIHTAENNMECDPSQLWNYINARKGTTRIPGRMVYKDTEYTAAHDIANAFSSYFSSVYLKPSPRDTQTEAYVFNDNVFSISEVSDSDILEATKKLKPKLTMGPDLVPAFIVKDCISCFVKPLCYIYNLCLKSATFPDKWKLSKVVPVFKTGDKCQIENYRPIGVICNFAKLFESIIAYYLYNHVSHCIAVEQHGFMKGRSVNTNLCNFTQYISDALDDKRQVDVIYTDISKAFDQVDHPTLLRKLHGYSVSDNLITFFNSYLTDRMQYVDCMGQRSLPYAVTSGVTQGSNLGPLLFLLFINDLVMAIQAPKLLYADDLKIFNIVDNSKSCLSLQNDINEVVKWCADNKLKINIGKCTVMTFTRKLTMTEFDYQINEQNVTRVTAVKDLGVIFDQKLSFNPHIEHVSSQAIKMLGFVIRSTKDFHNIKTLKTLYYAYVRSKLEYACVVWAPYYNAHIQSLERIQRKFCRYLYYTEFASYPGRDVSYCEMLNLFGLISMEMRWKNCQITYLYKILHGQIDDIKFLSQIKFHVPRVSARNCLTFTYKVPGTNQHMFSPLISMCRAYNHIQHNIDIFNCSISQLTNTLRNIP